MSGETTGRPRVSQERLEGWINLPARVPSEIVSAIMFDLRDARDLLRRAREALMRTAFVYHYNVESGDYYACRVCKGESNHGTLVLREHVAHNDGCLIAALDEELGND